MYDICAVAHITKDVNTTPTGTRTMPGGAAYYFSKSLHRLTTNSLLVTKLSPADNFLTQELGGINPLIHESAQTHFFENIYRDFSDDRRQKVHDLADPFKANEIKDIVARFFHLAPLSPLDIPIEIFKELSTRATISLDAQGYTRKISDSDVEVEVWDKLDQALKMVDILKVSQSEATIITGETDLRKAAIAMANYGIKEVIITRGREGSHIYFEDQLIEIPAYVPKEVVDPTGCGDTYMAGFLFKRSQGKGIIEAGKFGAAMATLKIEQFGALQASESIIQTVFN